MLKIILKFILWLASTGMLISFALLIALYYFVKTDLPSVDKLKDVRMQVPLRIYSADGKLMSEYGEKKRIPLRYDEIPKIMVEAFLSAEDDRYFEHPGVDYQGLLRAVGQLVLTGRRMQGGSTITMQVARNFFLSREKTYSRKLNEILLALRIDRELSKEEILELYLNKIYLGNRAYGIGAAAQVYYGKGVDQLSLAQVAMIAGLPKAPSTMNPIVNPERATTRRDYVLGRMLTLGHISDEAYQQAKVEPVTAVAHSVDVELDAPYVSEMVRAEMITRYGQDAYIKGLSVFTTLDSRLQQAATRALRENLQNYDTRHGYYGPEGHLELSTMDDELALEQLLADHGPVGGLRSAVVLELQEKSADVYVKGLGRATLAWKGLSWARRWISEDERGPALKRADEVLKQGDLVRVRQVKGEEGQMAWVLAQIPKVESALVSVDPSDGAIKALVGGFDYYKSKFNRVTQAKRQPGSGFKPVVYSAALERGFTAATLINDAPIVFDDRILESDWRPQNYSGKFYGPTRFRLALAKSRNLVSIRVLRDIGVKYAIKYATKFGFEPSTLPRNLSMALGTGVVTPLDMARTYSVLANGGFLVQPYFIDRIEEAHSGEVFKADPPRACPGCDVEESDQAQVMVANPAPRAITPQNHFLMNSILRDVITMGTATKAKALGRKDLAGKTGTTNDQRDAWFNGFHPNLVTTVWVGYDDSSPLGKKETGGGAALPAWMAYMKQALEGVPEVPLEMPAGMYKLRIDRKTGQPAPGQKNAIYETFRVGGAPNTAAGRGGSSSAPPPAVRVETVSEDLF